METPPRPRPADAPRDPARERSLAILRALKTQRRKLDRKLQAIQGDLDEARRAAELRRAGETLLAYLHQVPAGAHEVELPDPADPDRTITIEVDPRVKPQVVAARYFKRAAKAQRGQVEIPPRLHAVEQALAETLDLVERAEPALDSEAPLDVNLARELDLAFEKLPPNARRESGVAPLRSSAARPDAMTTRSPGERHRPELPARLQPRRLKTREGWDVLIGRNNDGNDHLTLHLARPEDYWFHVHGSPGSHVVLRRGKSKDEPSKATLREVAEWTAYYSKSATAGTVPVIWTLKKYVRKPRKAPPGTVTCEREKTIMVKPKEPERSSLADEAREAE